MKVRRKPIELEAVQLLRETWSEMCNFAEVGRVAKKRMCVGGRLELWVPTPHGLVLAEETNWIIKDTDGNLYPCVDSVFRASYEICEEARDA